MGTRSTVKFYSQYKTDKPILSVYQQFDGEGKIDTVYPTTTYKRIEL